MKTLAVSFLTLALIVLGTNAIITEQLVTQELFTLLSDLNVNQDQIANLLEFGKFVRDVVVWRARNRPVREYLGCFDEGQKDTTYRGYLVLDGKHMTNEYCMDLCGKQRFAYAATQAG